MVVVRLGAIFGHVFVDGGVEIAGLDDAWLKGEDECGVAGDHFGVVVLVDFSPRENGGVGFDEFVFDAGGLWVKGWWSEENELGSGGVDLVDEAVNAFLILDEATLGEGVVDAIVHAVAGDDKIGLDFGESAGEALGDIGSGKRVGRLGEAGDAFGWKAEGDHFGSVAADCECGLKVDDVVAGGGDGVAEEEDAFGAKKRAGTLPGLIFYRYFFFKVSADESGLFGVEDFPASEAVADEFVFVKGPDDLPVFIEFDNLRVLVAGVAIADDEVAVGEFL